MANEKRLIDADDALAAEFAIEEDGAIGYVVDSEVIRRLPTVDAYTAEQVASIIQQADKAEARNQELEKECAWLKSCLNCKIRKECPRHCGKVVHGCDHWEYGDSTVDAVEVVHGRWWWKFPNGWACSACGEWGLMIDNRGICKSNYCPNCGAKMDGGERQ